MASRFAGPIDADWLRLQQAGRGVAVGSDDSAVWVGRRTPGRGLVVALLAGFESAQGVAARLAPALLRHDYRLIVLATSLPPEALHARLTQLRRWLGWGEAPLRLLAIDQAAPMALRLAACYPATVAALALACEPALLWPQVDEAAAQAALLPPAIPCQLFVDEQNPARLADAWAWRQRYEAAGATGSVGVGGVADGAALLTAGATGRALAEEVMRFFAAQATPAAPLQASQSNLGSVRFMR